jgi:hypothetical protein
VDRLSQSVITAEISLEGTKVMTIARRIANLIGSSDTDVRRWVIAVGANGGWVSPTRLAIVTAFVAAEKASGAWSLTDDYWALWGENEAQALTSLKQRRLATKVNSPVFTVDRQFAFDGATSYLNTGFIPSTHAVAYTPNAQRLCVYERTNLSFSGYAAGVRVGTSPSLGIIPRASSSMTGVANNITTGATFTLSPADSRGLKAISRAGGTTMLGYDRGVRLTDVTGLTLGTLTLQSVALAIGCYNSGGTPISFRAASVGFVAIGAPLSDAQELAQYNAIQTFATAIGANV